MSELTVSVVIPAYKATRTIGRALESVFAQSKKPREVVVVDDGSPDDIATALLPYNEKVTLIRKINGGAATARNLGIEQSSGDLIAFLDADDYWEPDKLARQLAIFVRYPKVGLVGSRFFSQEPGSTRVIQKAGDVNLFGRVLAPKGREIFEVMEEFWTTTVVLRREALGENRFVPGLEPAEDRDLWIRLIASGPVYLDEQPLATWVLEPGSLSRSSIDKDCGNMLRVVRRHEALLGVAGSRFWEADTFRRWASVHLAQGRPAAALGRAWERLRLQPHSAQAWWICLKCMTLAAFSPTRRHRPL